ncbi:tetraspanin-9-like [Acanthaster planci]|uniref:Tetraspanin n=1 Tax=Acanthaster planci TaxID=133434 RepID=A0A8B7XS02_ACAPL|nr:tetraspanin-9-like [Acanthaster planci]XP_022083633.1 tetraspanin-9-like [Acanthaster planci]
MAVEGCAKVIKYLVFVFNLLFFLSGCAILALGIVLHVREGGYATLLPSLPFLNAANVCIAAGIIVLVVAFLGCCGAIKENACLLLLFFMFLLLIFILEIVAGIVGFVYRNQIQERVTADLKDGLEKYNTSGEEGLTDGWNRLQQKLGCCGVNSSSDWGNSVPDSCCVTFSDGCAAQPSPDIYQKGCLDKLIRQLEESIYYIAAGGIVIGLFQILGMVFAMVLYCNIKREGKYA